MSQMNTRFIGTVNANWVCGKAPETLLLTHEGIAAYKPRGWNRIWNPVAKKWMSLKIYDLAEWPMSMDVAVYVCEEMSIPGVPNRYDWRCDNLPPDGMQIVSSNTGEPIPGLFFCDVEFGIIGRDDIYPNGAVRTMADGKTPVPIWEERPVKLIPISKTDQR